MSLTSEKRPFRRPGSRRAEDKSIEHEKARNVAQLAAFLLLCAACRPDPPLSARNHRTEPVTPEWIARASPLALAMGTRPAVDVLRSIEVVVGGPTTTSRIVTAVFENAELYSLPALEREARAARLSQFLLMDQPSPPDFQGVTVEFDRPGILVTETWEATFPTAEILKELQKTPLPGSGGEPWIPR